MRGRLNQRSATGLVARDEAYDVRDSALAGFLLRVQPSGHKAWYFQYRLASGRQTRAKLGTFPHLSAEGARSLATQRAAEVGRGIDPISSKRAALAEAQRDKLRTLGAFLELRYAPWAQSHFRSGSAQLARIRCDYGPWFDRPMAELSPFLVESLRLGWKAKGRKPATVNRDVQRLYGLLSRAVAWGVLERHPLKGLKPLKTDKVGRVRFLSEAEQAALRRALDEREARLREARLRFNTWRIARHLPPLPERGPSLIDHLKPIVLLAMNTGLRRGELLGLRWGDINLPAMLLTVRATSAKSGQTRRLPLNREALELLRAWKGRHQSSSLDDLVFPGPDGRRMNSINNSWPSLMKAAGIVDFRFHDLRHHFASSLVQAGVDLYTVRALLGHSAIEMTERYAHLAPDNLRAAVEKIAR